MIKIQSKGKAIILALCLVLLPVAALAATAVLNGDGFLGWQAVGGSGAVASTGGTYQLHGAAGIPGAHQGAATGGAYSLSGGYIPVADVDTTPVVPLENPMWLPIISRPPTPPQQ